jgi:hypothetical protein
MEWLLARSDLPVPVLPGSPASIKIYFGEEIGIGSRACELVECGLQAWPCLGGLILSQGTPRASRGICAAGMRQTPGIAPYTHLPLVRPLRYENDGA